jgi:UDP-glucose 4-epimerase
VRLLITGGAGTLGRSIIERWEDLASTIHVIDNFATSDPDYLSGFPSVTLHHASIDSLGDLEEAFRAALPTHVIHCAASYKDPNDWTGDISTNILGGSYVSQLSDKYKVERLISIQTVLCYGRPSSVPIPIDAPLRPESSYAISKVAGEEYLALGSTPFVSLRVGNVISPGLAIGPIPTFYSKLKSGDTIHVTRSVRDFLDIADFLDALDKAMGHESPIGAFNISSGEGTSMLRIFELVSQYLNITAQPNILEPQPDDISEIILDPSQTLESLGWQVRVPLEVSLRNCLRFYDEHGVGTIYTHLRSPGVKNE